MSTTDRDEDKTPSEEIDDEEKENNPVKETQEQMDHEKEREKKTREKKEKEEKEKVHQEKKTAAERHRDAIRCKIDTVTYEHRLSGLEEHLEMEKKRSRMRLEGELQDLEFQCKRRKLNHKQQMLQSQITLKEKKKEWNDWIDREPEYLENPMKELDHGEIELVLSDRIIELSGAITYYTSEYVTDRIHYYNNQSDSPIFLIIDHSPGGSVMAGYRILKAMDSSQADVYVIVKSFAASMAATITTLAKHSFAYPNAIILHHQIWSRSAGNLRQHEEQLVDLKEWWRRLAEPLAQKLNLTTNQWRTMMYEKNSDGDWREFGDEAVKLGWVDYVVHRLRKTGKDRHPDKTQPLFCFFCQTNGCHEKHNQSHERYLPCLRPLDYYWVYNPDNYYQIQDDLMK